MRAAAAAPVRPPGRRLAAGPAGRTAGADGQAEPPVPGSSEVWGGAGPTGQHPASHLPAAPHLLRSLFFSFRLFLGLRDLWGGQKGEKAEMGEGERGNDDAWCNGSPC